MQAIEKIGGHTSDFLSSFSSALPSLASLLVSDGIPSDQASKLYVTISERPDSHWVSEEWILNRHVSSYNNHYFLSNEQQVPSFFCFGVSTTKCVYIFLKSNGLFAMESLRNSLKI